MYIMNLMNSNKNSRKIISFLTIIFIEIIFLFSNFAFANEAKLEEANIKEVFISEDSTSIIARRMDSSIFTLLAINDLPKESSIAEGLYLNSKIFSYVKLSPNKSLIAFSAHGNVNDWSGLFYLETKKIEELIFLHNGKTGNLFWSPNSDYIAIENYYASGLKGIEIIPIYTKKRFSPGIGKLKNEYFDKNLGGIETFNPVWIEKNTISFMSHNQKDKSKIKWKLDLSDFKLEQIDETN